MQPDVVFCTDITNLLELMRSVLITNENIPVKDIPPREYRKHMLQSFPKWHKPKSITDDYGQNETSQLKPATYGREKALT